MDKSERKLALEIARSAVELWVKERKKFRPVKVPKSFSEKRGCFVTLTEDGDLRGCIGFPEHVLPLIEALVSAAIEATQDPRFPELDVAELNKIHIEVSVLTQPKPIKPDDVKVGRDGLIIRRGFRSGLLLPQVAVEYGWTREQFLGHTCAKAGLPTDTWKSAGVELLAFQADVFGE
jgi:AmmeMemoRadiSam system protein A